MKPRVPQSVVMQIAVNQTRVNHGKPMKNSLGPLAPRPPAGPRGIIGIVVDNVRESWREKTFEQGGEDGGGGDRGGVAACDER